ncbi:hypothetical protein [Aurantimonas sp. VKM B-3413]|uniref:hypothetical protein n=1 Tax=Aurantimonas sp. VKM B-3413 TaxID=2779401 RepID=UPI001E64C111|nr:hypothetical protein [Aurantimonas sp. VKM B-3413]MCB8837977.1 hypothetical protein [Aurantimonas sp. VKM B-3413]
MADLSGVLRKTIDGLPQASPQMREKVYEKARAAIQRQINAANPPLAENVVAARLSALEDAIKRTEQHYSGNGEGAPAAAEAPQDQPPQAAPPASSPGAPRAATPPASAPRPAPSAPQTAQNPSAGAASTAPAMPRAAPPAPQPSPAKPASAPPAMAPQAATPQPNGGSPAARGPATQPPVMPPMVDAESSQPRPAPPASPAPRTEPPRSAAAIPEPGQESADQGRRTPPPFFPPETEAPEVDDRPATIGAPFIVPSEGEESDSVGGTGPALREANGRARGEPRIHDDSRVPSDIRIDDTGIPEADLTAPRYTPRRAQRRGRGPSALAAVAVILLLGGLGTAGWIYRDELEALLVEPGGIDTIANNSAEPTGEATSGSGAVGQTEAQNSPPGVAEDTTVAANEPANSSASTRQFTQRLMPDGTEVDEGPAKAAPNAFDEGTNVAAASPVTEQPAPSGEATPTVNSEIGENPSVVGGTIPGTASGEPGATAADTPAEATATTANSSANGVPQVAQKAVFYQEKTEDLPGTQESGNVVWSVIKEPPADGQPAEAAIRAVADVPDENLKLTMTIKRNTDPTLPASHVIELLFEVPKDFSGGGVANVQRLALKDTEQARGEPLIGVAGKISDNFFIIALNNLDQAVQNNLSLLQSEQWIDIPLAYASGRRALMSIEKGIPGDRAFKEAIAAWNAKT